MKILKTEKNKNDIIYFVEVDENEWKKQQDQTFKNLAKKLKVPGFRAGHTPTEIAKQHISTSDVMYDSVNPIANKNYKLLIESKEFKGDDLIEDAVSIDLDKVSANQLVIKYVFESYPVVTLPDYKKIKINYKEPEVTEEEVDRQFKQSIKSDILLTPKKSDVIEKGDMVNFDYKGYVDDKPFPGGEAKDHELEIGSNTFIPGFEDQMIGLKKGEKKSINVTFPKDYHAKHLADKVAKFELVINDIKTIQNPILDEKFFAKLRLPKEVKDEKSFKAFLKDRILKYKTGQAKEDSIKEISEYLIKNSKISYFPKSIIETEEKRIDEDTNKKADQRKQSHDDYIKKTLGYKNLDDYKKVLKETAERNITLVLSLEKIIEELKIDVTTQEIDKHLQEMADAYGMKLDDIKKRLNSNFDQIETFLTQEKVFDKLIELNKNNK